MHSHTAIRTMSKKDFAWFGIFERAYVKPVTQGGMVSYGVFAADGSLLSRAPDLGTAFFIVREEFAMEAVRVH